MYFPGVIGRTDSKAEGLEVEVLHTSERLWMLADEWRALETCTHDRCNVFQRFDWCWKWHDRIGKGNRLFVISVRRGGQLVSVWPLEIIRHGPVSRLCWLSHDALEYGGALIHHDCHPRDVFSAVWPVIASAPVDLVQLSAVDSTSVLHPLLGEMCLAGRKTHAFHINLAGIDGWQGWQSGLKAKTRRVRNKRFNKLSRQGKLTFSVHAGGPRYRELTGIALEWKHDWLKKRHWPANLVGDPAFRDFLDGLGRDEAGQKDGWLAAELSVDGQPVAIELGAVCGPRYLSYLGAYDPAFAKFSPGKIELAMMIRWCLENGIAIYDLLCNRSQYKADWSNCEAGVEDFDLALTLSGRVFHSIWLKRLKPAIKAGLQRLPGTWRGAVFAAAGRTCAKPGRRKVKGFQNVS